MLNKFLKNEIGVICNTQDEEKQFLSFLEKNTHLLWLSGDKPTWWSAFEHSYAGTQQYGCNGSVLWRDDECLNTIQFKDFIKKVKPKTYFNKNKLKTGMIVEYRNGSLRMVWGNRLLNENLRRVHSLNFYRNDLTDMSNQRHFDIMKVYNIYNENESDCTVEIGERELLWERVEI